MTRVHTKPIQTKQVQWPAERFYWSVLEAPQWKRSGPLPPGLRALLEEEVPGSPETLHAVCAPLGDGRLLVCAAEREELHALAEDVIGLTPESLPGFAGSGVAPAALNLLVGELEPRPLRQTRTRRHLLAAASVLLTSGLLVSGLLRRESSYEQSAREVARDAAALVAEISPNGDGSPEGITFEVARLRRLHESAARIQPPPDAALSLAALLRTWPGTVSSKPQSLSVSETGAAVSVSVEGDATPFLKALKAPAGWSLDEPRVNTAGTVTRLSLQLRAPSAAGGVR